MPDEHKNLVIELDGQPLTLAQIARVADGDAHIKLADTRRESVTASRRVVEEIIASGQTVYGVNTGFGKLSDYVVPSDELRELQLNLVRSHACGIGNPLSIDETRAMMLLRANVLAKGFSGARVEVIEMLIALLERGVHPVIPEKGSVGASGDLAPLAHLALVLIGEGEAFYQGEKLAGAVALQQVGLEPLQLEAKEGIALLNGTQAMAAIGGLAVRRAITLSVAADVACAMTHEALLATPTAYDGRIHRARPHAGQVEVARHLCELLQDSEIRASHLENDSRVQDAYSLRCAPQVHGAVRDCLMHACGIVEIESGSATDNPLVFADTGEILSGGNFHGAPLGFAFDYAAIALTDLAGISERRTERLVNPDLSEGLPPFLAAHAGTSSGLMIAQVAAVALIAEMKVLSHPASVDNLPTSGNKEDHVSMGMTAATKLRTVVENAEHVLAIELLAAAEGLEYRRPLKAGTGVEQAHKIVRSHVARLTQDRALSNDIQRLAQAIRRGEFAL
ncbi:MAG: histidine ammonia-lyase [Pyrinomonadaceae bacterium MAG19_C2-C3]|nr:histidine ammonia-lyase [Pyrinomonadaceae bacterium MAG19_C2-C3]